MPINVKSLNFTRKHIMKDQTKPRKFKFTNNSNNPDGGPIKPVDIEQISKLAQIGCTYVEIAAFVGLDTTTLNRRYKDIITKGHATMKRSLRRKQIEVAMDTGSVQMLIWLGKQNLGQTDKVEQEITQTNTPNITVEFVDSIPKATE